MENAEKLEDDVMMDFESGIDTWIIDKDDSVGSFSSFEKTRKESNGEKNMNKENIKKSSSDKKNLRSFRIQKRVSYQELSSESDTEMNKRSEDECSRYSSKKSSESSNFPKYIISSSRTSSKEVVKDVENLSSEEISIMLSDDDSKDCSSVSKRERLHSIENVSSTIDSKSADNSSSPLLNVKCNTSMGICKFNSIDTEYPDEAHQSIFKLALKRNYSTESDSNLIERPKDSSVSLSKRRFIRCSNNGSYDLKTDYHPPEVLKTQCEQTFKRTHSNKYVFSSNFNRTEDESPPHLTVVKEVTCQICCKHVEFCHCDLNESGCLDGTQGNKHKMKSLKTYRNNRKTLPALVNSDIISIDDSSHSNPEELKLNDGQSLKCSICGYISAELFIHKSHQIMIHKEETDLQCEYCNYKTTQYASLATHIRVHFRLDCPYCDYHCCLKSSLASHQLRYHQNAYPYNCKTCGYSCETQIKLIDHLQLHAKKNFQCNECKKFFSNKMGLRKHVKKHLVELNIFKCYKCDLSFSQPQNLKLHMKSHRKPNGIYSCRTCKALFTNELDLKNHLKTHIVVLKSFKCNECESVFSQKNHLKLHMKVHLSKYTKCKHCAFKCTDSKEINNHICVPVNQLYAVEKRSLNFEFIMKDGKLNNIKRKPKVKGELKKIAGNEKGVLFKTPSCSNVVDLKSRNEKKPDRRNSKVLALRQNVRRFKTAMKDDRQRVKMSNKHRNPKGKVGRPRKQLVEKKSKIPVSNNMDFRNGTCQNKHNSVSKNVKNTKRQRKVTKTINKEQLFRGLEMASLLSKQEEAMKKLLLEPVAFTNNSFIECYYQSQQPSSAAIYQHQERHLRRPTLLSCRFCSYKTNSQQLLKCHINKNHKWDPAVVSKLFRP